MGKKGKYHHGHAAPTTRSTSTNNNNQNHSNGSNNNSSSSQKQETKFDRELARIQQEIAAMEHREHVKGGPGRKRSKSENSHEISSRKVHFDLDQNTLYQYSPPLPKKKRAPQLEHVEDRFDGSGWKPSPTSFIRKDQLSPSPSPGLRRTIMSSLKGSSRSFEFEPLRRGTSTDSIASAQTDDSVTDGDQGSLSTSDQRSSSPLTTSSSPPSNGFSSPSSKKKNKKKNKNKKAEGTSDHDVSTTTPTPAPTANPPMIAPILQSQHQVKPQTQSPDEGSLSSNISPSDTCSNSTDSSMEQLQRLFPALFSPAGSAPPFTMSPNQASLPGSPPRVPSPMSSSTTFSHQLLSPPATTTSSSNPVTPLPQNPTPVPSLSLPDSPTKPLQQPLPPLMTSSNVSKSIPRHQWFQTANTITLNIYVKGLPSLDAVSTFVVDGHSTLALQGADWTWGAKFPHRVSSSKPAKHRITKAFLEVTLEKEAPGLQWASVGHLLDLPQIADAISHAQAKPDVPSSSDSTQDLGVLETKINRVRDDQQSTQTKVPLETEMAQLTINSAPMDNDKGTSLSPGATVKLNPSHEEKPPSSAPMPSPSPPGNDVEVDFVHHDWEENNERVTLSVITKLTFHDVVFSAASCSIRFSTNDESFLMLNKGTSSTVFAWIIDTFRPINAALSSIKMTPQKLVITLVKTEPCKWGALEAPVARGNSSPTQNAPPHVLVPDTLQTVESTPQNHHATSTPINGSKPDTSSHPKAEHSPKEQGSPSTTTTTRIPMSHTSPSSASVRPSDPLLQNSATPSFKIGTGPYTAGACGLDNIGNTCFMNAALQGLSHLQELRDYFLSREYEPHISKKNPHGYKGALSNTFADLLKTEWSGQFKSTRPRIKSVFEDRNKFFRGQDQHDAHEFLTFFLDGLHEDLNDGYEQRIPFTPPSEVELDKMSNKERAAVRWKEWRSKNISKIFDLFFGMYQSTITCGQCNHVSTTFDPLSSVTLPLPQRTRKQVIYFVGVEGPIVRCCLEVPLVGDMMVLRKKLSVLLGVPISKYILCEVYKGKLQRVYANQYRLEDMQPTDEIYVYELPSVIAPTRGSAPVFVLQRKFVVGECSTCGACGKKPAALLRCTKCYNIAYCDAECQRVGWATHAAQCRKPGYIISGIPFLLPRDLSSPSVLPYADLFKMVKGEAKRFNGCVMPHAFRASLSPISRFGLDDSGIKLVQTEPVDLAKIEVLGLDWYCTADVPTPPLLKDHGSYTKLMALCGPPSPTSPCPVPPLPASQDPSLLDAFRLFSSSEILDDPWRCPTCKTMTQATKQIFLYEAPHYLVVHLKRFSMHDPTWREKLGFRVDFPLSGLDLGTLYADAGTYDLACVVNHHGSIWGGHYTACCKIPESATWHVFDDELVRETTEAAVQNTKDAYLLLYVRRSP